MTLKQKKLIKAYQETGNKTQAAIIAGYSKKSAHVLGHRELEKVKPELNRLMDRIGLSEKSLLEPIKRGLVARAIYQGVETEAPDHSNRLKSTELAWKLRGHLKSSGDAPSVAGASSPTIVFVINTSEGEHRETLAVRVGPNGEADRLSDAPVPG